MTNKIFLLLVLFGTLSWQGCDDEVEPAPIDCTANPVVIELVSTDDANCSQEDGRIEVNANGGTGTYQYRMGTGAAQASGVFEGVGAGSYKISATDENNCSTTLDVSVRNLEGLNISFETTAAGCGTSSGTLTVNAVDGTTPYQYKLDAGAFGSTNTFSNLTKGDHQLIVTDAAGCEITQTVKLTSGVSFATSISPIIETKCAVSGCHAGTQAPDFRVFNNIKNNAAMIKTLTGNKTMPQEGSLTQTQINLIACWVDDGAPAN